MAQQAFWGFYQSLRAGRLPRLTNRQQLLALLSHITACQAANQIKHELGVQKRPGASVRGESALDFAASHDDDRGRGLEQVADSGLSPTEQAILDDCYRHYLSDLPEHLRDFAESYLAGLTYQEIANRLGCTERTVDRKMAIILNRWQRLAAANASGVVLPPNPPPS